MPKNIPLLILALSLVSSPLRAEVPKRSTDELKSDASHIVIGKVQAVYSTKRKSADWEDTDLVAQLTVLQVEKGTQLSPGDVVYSHYWNKKWTGKGDPEPHSTGHGGVSKGDFVRAHLTRKNGTFRVLLPNGFTSLKPEKIKLAPSKATARLQGTWSFAYYEEKGTKVETGSRQFVIDDKPLGLPSG